VFERLNVPRMSRQLYYRMIEEFMPKLDVFFERVVVPRDAPNKPDHGDIDFLVGGIRVPLRGDDLWKRIEGALAADHRAARGGSQSYAIPHPNISDAHIQVDVELAPGDGTLGGDDLFAWTKLMKGDADLMQIIGITHRPLGLVCNDRGLHVRIEEIEPYDKKKALIFLTRDVRQAIEFYDFDVPKYEDGFQSENEIFDWVAGGRFFSPWVFKQTDEKADDRSRRRKRPMYRRFVDEYMPGRPETSDKIWTRQEVLDAALKKFDVQEEYDEKMTTHKNEQAEESLWKEIKDLIPLSDIPRKTVIKALHRFVMFDQQHQPVFLLQPIPPENQFRWSNFVNDDTRPDLLEWVKANWKEANERERNAAVMNGRLRGQANLHASSSFREA
jgi:hypothetical protein